MRGAYGKGLRLGGDIHDRKSLLAVLRPGLASPEHAALVAELARK
jgi:hypothetical protein